MKPCIYLIFLTAALECVSPVFAGDNKPIASVISEVTVYLSGAEIKRTATTTLSQGMVNLVFEGLSPAIDGNSIQVKGKGAFTILSVSHQLNYLKDQPKQMEITLLEDSLKQLNSSLEYQQAMQNVYEQEESLLLTNKEIGNKDVGVDAADLEAMAQFFRRRLSEIRLKVIETKQLQKELQEQINRIRNQLNTLNVNSNKTTSEIIVSVSCTERTPARFDFSYFVTAAGWVPVYDLRADESMNGVKLDYKAQVYQNTGVDWDNVKITLSTINPTRSGSKPVLLPWTLVFGYPVVYRSQSSKSMQIEQAVPQKAMNEGMYLNEELQQAPTAADFTVATQTQVSAEFAIALPYSIPSDGKMHTVEVQRHELKATFNNYAVPKLDRDAFLLAKVMGWEEYNILSGEASIYFDGAYVGKSFIDAHNISDTLDLSFGRDKSIVITREKIKDFTSKKAIGSNKKETFAYEISVRNTKKNPVDILIEDQVPLTSNKEIEVELISHDGVEHNAETGKLSWRMTLASAETKKIRFIFSVKYPKDRVISKL